MSRNIGEEARRLLNKHDHDHYAQDDALNISPTSNQDGGVKNDCLDRRPCRRIEGAQVCSEQAAGQPAERGSEDIGLQFQLVDVTAESGCRTFVLAKGAQREAKAAPGDSRHEDKDEDEQERAEAKEEVLVGLIVKAKGIPHRVEQTGQPVVTVEQGHILAGHHIQYVDRS